MEQLALLRTVAAVRFEDYVLKMLSENAPRSWSIQIDAEIHLSDNGMIATGASSGNPPIARVDAMISTGSQSAILEVRPRLQPDSREQIDAVHTWLSTLPDDLPVILVVLGEGLLERQFEQLSANRHGALELLLWDREPDSLLTTLRRHLERSDAFANVG